MTRAGFVDANDGSVIAPADFVYDVATDLAAASDGIFIVDMSADTGDVATVEMKRRCGDGLYKFDWFARCSA